MSSPSQHRHCELGVVLNSDDIKKEGEEQVRSLLIRLEAAFNDSVPRPRHTEKKLSRYIFWKKIHLKKKTYRSHS